jgi:UDP-glucose 4-epimerase
MRVMVTGGLGVNGAWVVRELLAGGHDPVAVDVQADFRLLPDLEGQIEFEQLDVRDLDGLERVMRSRDVECVAHLAALIPADRDPHAGFEINAMGTVNVLEAARRSEVRRVAFTSSKAVYAAMTGRHGHPEYVPIDESHPRAPFPRLRVYSASKILAEEAGCQYADAYGLEFLALRFAAIYAPGKHDRQANIGVLATIVENAMRGEPVRVEHGGDQGDDMMYVKDVANAVVRACVAERPRNWAFNVGTGTASTLREFADAVRAAVPGADIEVGAGFDHLGLGPMYCVMDISRARDELGYEPRYGLREGVADYVATARALGLARA